MYDCRCLVQDQVISEKILTLISISVDPTFFVFCLFVSTLLTHVITLWREERLQMFLKKMHLYFFQCQGLTSSWCLMSLKTTQSSYYEPELKIFPSIQWDRKMHLLHLNKKNVCFIVSFVGISLFYSRLIKKHTLFDSASTMKGFLTTPGLYFENNKTLLLKYYDFILEIWWLHSENISPSYWKYYNFALEIRFYSENITTLLWRYYEFIQNILWRYSGGIETFKIFLF